MTAMAMAASAHASRAWPESALPGRRIRALRGKRRTVPAGEHASTVKPSSRVHGDTSSARNSLASAGPNKVRALRARAPVGWKFGPAEYVIASTFSESSRLEEHKDMSFTPSQCNASHPAGLEAGAHGVDSGA